jgi:hypothetical protein
MPWRDSAPLRYRFPTSGLVHMIAGCPVRRNVSRLKEFLDVLKNSRR